VIRDPITPKPFLVITTKNSQRTPLTILLSQGLSFRSTCHCPSMRYMVQQLRHFIWFPSTCQPRAGILSLTLTPSSLSLKVTSAPLRNCLCYATPPSTHDISLGKPPGVISTKAICITMLLPKSNSQVNKSSHLIYYQGNVVFVICPALRAISSPVSSDMHFQRVLTCSRCIMNRLISPTLQTLIGACGIPQTLFSFVSWSLVCLASQR